MGVHRRVAGKGCAIENCGATPKITLLLARVGLHIRLYVTFITIFEKLQPSHEKRAEDLILLRARTPKDNIVHASPLGGTRVRVHVRAAGCFTTTTVRRLPSSHAVRIGRSNRIQTAHRNPLPCSSTNRHLKPPAIYADVRGARDASEIGATPPRRAAPGQGVMSSFLVRFTSDQLSHWPDSVKVTSGGARKRLAAGRRKGLGR